MTKMLESFVLEIVEEKKAEEPKVEEVPELDYVSRLEKVVEFINYYLKNNEAKAEINLQDHRVTSFGDCIFSFNLDGLGLLVLA